MKTTRRPRFQTGSVTESRDRRSFWIRFYTTKNGKRVQTIARLCDKDHVHYSKTSRAVKLTAQEFMAKVNAGRAEDAGPDVLVTDFHETVYLPHITENLRPSSVKGYLKIWHQHLAPHFAGRTLGGYRTHHGSEFLTGLAKRLGRRTLAHIRSAASGIFTLAMNKGLIESNPWHDVKVLAKVRAPESTPHYTLEEAEDIIAALVERLDAQAIFAVAFFLGLRPGEVAGLRWEDLDEDWVHVRRAVVGGVVGTTKTPESIASLPLIQPLKGILALWRERSGLPSEGWVFPNKFNRPLDLGGFARRVFEPVLGARWKSLYACRRGAGTALVGLTGNLVAAQELLRHKSLTTTAAHYKKQTAEALTNGMRLLEAAAESRSTNR